MTSRLPNDPPPQHTLDGPSLGAAAATISTVMMNIVLPLMSWCHVLLFLALQSSDATADHQRPLWPGQRILRVLSDRRSEKGNLCSFSALAVATGTSCIYNLSKVAARGTSGAKSCRDNLVTAGLLKVVGTSCQRSELYSSKSHIL